MAAYVKSLNNYRKQLRNQAPAEEAVPPTQNQPGGGLVPSSARQAAQMQTQQQTQVRYEPAMFVREGIKRFSQARADIKLRSVQPKMEEGAAGGFAKGFAQGIKNTRVENTKEKASSKNTQGLVGRPYKGLPDGPKGQEVYAVAQDGDLFSLIDKTEGGGNYSTLFGHSQREGGQFAGTDVSNMTVDEVLDFTKPSGAYGQWVKGKVGRVATPIGRHQIVGSTLKAAAAELGIGGNTVFSAQTQDRIANHLAYKRISGAKTQEAKRAALRSEWEGFKHVSDATLDAAIAKFEDQYMKPKRGETNKKDEV